MRRRYPNVVELYGAFEDESRYFIVMEYCSGAPAASTSDRRPFRCPGPTVLGILSALHCTAGGDLLEKLLREKKAISERRVATMVAIPCLVTLRCLHAASIIHRYCEDRRQIGTA